MKSMLSNKCKYMQMQYMKQAEGNNNEQKSMKSEKSQYIQKLTQNETKG